jgi:hypothetical protein
MPPSPVDARPLTVQPGVERALCILVVAIMFIAVIYAAWISIGNFSRIGV